MKFLVDNELKHESGIYVISIVGSTKIYVGQTINLYRRFLEHKRNLELGKHTNRFLVHSVEKYGLENVVFQIVSLCAPDCLDFCEKFWILKADKNQVLNLVMPDEITGTNRGLTHTLETRLKMSSMAKSYLSGVQKLIRSNGRIRWRTTCYFKHKNIYLGTFDTEEIANQVYLDALKNIENGIDPEIVRLNEPGRIGKSGHRNIVWSSESNKWKFIVRKNGCKCTLGSFQSLEEAVAAKKNYFESNTND